MRYEWMALALVATVSACSSSRQRLEPLLPMDDAAPVFISANCALPVKVVRTVRPPLHLGDPKHVLVEHICEDLRDITAPKLSMAVQFDEDTRRIVYMYLFVGASDVTEVDLQFERAYSALIEPYVTPIRRAAIRKFSSQRWAGEGGGEWNDFDIPSDVFAVTVAVAPRPSRELMIRRDDVGQ